MKQHITKEQWKELSDKEMMLLIKFFSLKEMPPKYYIDTGADLTIGQMIEFLGDSWSVDLNLWTGEYFALPENKEICDSLWEAVKYKLKQ